MKTKKFKLTLIIISVVLAIVSLATIFSFAIYASALKLDNSKLERKQQSISVFDNQNNLITTNQSYTLSSDIPATLKNAFIATEDKRFYQHKGLDYKRIIGALIYDLKTHSTGQGASTISCQLIKNTHLSNEKTFKRKLDEAILAKKLEKQYSKQQILEMYLNVIYFGSGIYGVTNAAYMYFNKTPSELTLSECASLAAVVVNPKKYSPLLNADNNNERKNTILKLMQEQGYISEDQCEQATKQQVATNSPQSVKYNDYISLCLTEAANILGIDELVIKQNGYKIYTYLDNQKQKSISEAIKEATVSTSICISDSNNYSLVAYCANHPYSPFTLKRNMGSIIKPFIYASAFENEILYPITQIQDQPTAFGNYAPKNFNNSYKGQISVRDALSVSSNVCAVKVLQSVGFEKSISTLKDFGFETTKNDENYSLALGATKQGATLTQILAAYGVFSNGGYYAPLKTIRMIEDANGNILYINNQSPTRILSDRAISMVNDCLNECANTGTAKRLKDYQTLCAKTGTFQVKENNSDAWSVVYDNHNVYCVWQGNLTMKQEDMINKRGSSGINFLLSTLPQNPTSAPINIKKQKIDTLCLQRTNQIKKATTNTPQRYITYDFLPKTAEYSTLFTQPKVNANVTLQNNTIQINLQAYKECEYYIYNNSTLAQIITNKEGDLTIYLTPSYGTNQITITPLVHGNLDLFGIPYQERVYY